MAAFYPHQELAPETVRGYLFEFEGLAMKHGMRRLEDAFLTLRSKPGQRFFPHPSEVAEEIEKQIDSGRHERQMHAQTTRRHREIAEFWAWAPEWMEMTGNDEAELLRRFPSYKNTRPGSQRMPGRNVVQMPGRDAGDAA